MPGPRLATVHYSRQFARASLQLCMDAYRAAHGEPFVLPDGFSAPVLFSLPSALRPGILACDDLDTWGFTTQFDGKIYVVFRGTQNGPEWFADVLALPMESFYEGSCHRGFFAIYKAIRQSVLNSLPEGWLASDLIIMGHSLGAALATLFFLDVGRAGTLITFASPRVVDPPLAAILWNTNTFRVQNLPDVVPKLSTDPPFRHGGPEVLFRGPGSDFSLKEGHSGASYDVGLLNTPE